MAFDPALPVGTDNGPKVVDDTRDNLNELKTLVDAKVPQSGSGTWAVTPTWSGQHIWDGAGPLIKRSAGGDFAIFEQKTIEAAHTNAHKMRVLATDAGATITWRPEIDGVDAPTKQLMFNYTAEQWEIGNSGDQVWHAGNLDPNDLAPASLKPDVIRTKCNVLTSSTSVAIDPAVANNHFIKWAHTGTFAFTLPSGADADLGTDYAINGTVVIENIAGSGTITLTATGADIIETNGTQDTTDGTVMVLAYEIIRVDIGGQRRIVNFSWIS